MVKSYLGYYEEALELFRKCNVFFSKAEVSTELPNVKFNRSKGFLNSLHQTVRCLIELSKLKEAQKITEQGLAASGTSLDFYLERSYFFQLKGMIAYHQNKDHVALLALNNSLPGMEKKNDFTNESLIYYYRGKSYWRLQNKKEALSNFAKVDSIFAQHHFILPETRGSYETLLDYYHESGDKEKLLYYTTQLLKADRLLSADFRYLSGKIHKEYDTQDLLTTKKQLETSVSYQHIVASVLCATLFVLIIVFYLKRKSEKKLQRKYKDLMIKMETEKKPKEDRVRGDMAKSKKVPDAVAALVLLKLEELEKRNFFLEKGMTVHKLAPQLNTNSTYLSKIIGEYKGCYYNAYLKNLRIDYVTAMLCEHKKWRNYSVETLANECGFADRTNFSKAFYDHNQISVVDFIDRRNREVKENT